MPRHAELEAGFFKDPDIKKLLEENSDAVLLYIYYTVSCPNLLGIYQTDEKDDRVSIRYPLKKFVKAKSSVLQSRKIVFEDGWVWVVGKGNRIKGPKQWAAARKLLRELPKGLKIKEDFIKKYREDAIRYGYPIDRVSDLEFTEFKKFKKSKKNMASEGSNRNEIGNGAKILRDKQKGIPYPYPIDRVSANALPIPIPKKEELPKGNSRKPKIPKGESKPKTDSRVPRLLKFFGVVFKDTFGVIYKANFKVDGKIIKDQLQYAEKAYPKNYAEVGLAISMDEWLEKQKDLKEFKKTTIAGWLKDFNSINTDIDWQKMDWEDKQKEYEDVQNKS